ncbi:Potassium channel domain [Dillenia turbinata]|uniref:Potassium channel domain n=1 Tax=Dillenia turbinata TaxID=194707 RepID=A0AAN8VVV2_9MAGN
MGSDYLNLDRKAKWRMGWLSQVYLLYALRSSNVHSQDTYTHLLLCGVGPPVPLGRLFQVWLYQYSGGKSTISFNSVLPNPSSETCFDAASWSQIESLKMEAAEPLLVAVAPQFRHYHQVEPPPLPSSRATHTHIHTQSNPTRNWKKRNLHRCKTAPAMAVVMPDSKMNLPQNSSGSDQSNSLVKQALVLLLLYLALGVLIYSFNRDRFSGMETHPVVDALYFCIVTMCTIGYGDIAPLTPATKAFACVFVLVGFGFIDTLLSAVVNYVLDLQENMILAGAGPSGNCIIMDLEKGRMRIRLKVGLALGVVVLCVGMGSAVLYYVEELEWIDSVYLAVMSVTTVGYGDKVFKTVGGRLFAAIWLLLSTLAVGRAFLYLAEARVDRRHRRIAKWVLHRDITVDDLLAADMNNNGFISKSEYVVFKLKEMGKIGENDIIQICNQFNKLDPANSGKITLPNLLQLQRQRQPPRS